MNTFHVIRRADLALGDRFSTRNRNWRGRLRLTEARERVFQAAFDHSERTGATLKGYINLLAWHSHPGNDARVCHAFYERNAMGALRVGDVADFLADAGSHRVTFETGNDILQLREWLFEVVRRRTTPSGQSRLDCCFSYVELADAHAFLAECRRDGDPTRRRSLICTLETQDGARQAHYDRNLYDAVELDQPFAEAERRARSYWSGERSDTPALECLTAGDVRLTAI